MYFKYPTGFLKFYVVRFQISFAFALIASSRVISAHQKFCSNVDLMVKPLQLISEGRGSGYQPVSKINTHPLVGQIGGIFLEFRHPWNGLDSCFHSSDLLSCTKRATPQSIRNFMNERQQEFQLVSLAFSVI